MTAAWKSVLDITQATVLLSVTGFSVPRDLKLLVCMKYVLYVHFQNPPGESAIALHNSFRILPWWPCITERGGSSDRSV